MLCGMLRGASMVMAGLVCITSGSGFVQPVPTFVSVAAAGMPCYLACTTLKSKLGCDDSPDVFGIHAVGGTLGALLGDVFATLVILKVFGVAIGLRESRETEVNGLDLSEHGEEGYIL
ncbi:MAG: hypothetical protein CMJ62_02125 [Planctomycetaceae bacterium]|nr:hypothetical protein [Planctomycetaceae bacterium]